MITNLAFLIVLSILGIVDSGYLTWTHYKKKPLICPLNNKCDKVTESKWSRIFFVRNDVLGLLFYIFIFISGFLIYYFNLELIKNLIFLSSSFGFLFSLFLLYVQAKIIKNYCLYCIISSLITFLIFLNSFFI